MVAGLNGVVAQSDPASVEYGRRNYNKKSQMII